MVDNFEKIANFLGFKSDDDFYFLQILQRKKGGQIGKVKPLIKQAKMIKRYSNRSVEHLFEKKEEVVELCNVFGARAQLNVNKRSYKKCAYATLKEISDCLYHENYRAASDAFNSSCGKYSAEEKESKKWVVDIDESDVIGSMDSYTQSLLSVINEKCKPEGDKLVEQVPSKNGVHLITSPFDVQTFKTYHESVEIHKDSFTNLYIP